MYLNNGNYTVTNNIFPSGQIAISQLHQSSGVSIVKNNLALTDTGFQFGASTGAQIFVENNTLVGNGSVGIGMYVGYGEIYIRNNIITDFGVGFSAKSTASKRRSLLIPIDFSISKDSWSLTIVYFAFLTIYFTIFLLTIDLIGPAPTHIK